MLTNLPTNPELNNIFIHLKDKEQQSRSLAISQLSSLLLKYPEYVQQVLLRITEGLKNSENIEFKFSCVQIAQLAPRVIRQTQVVFFVQRIMPFVFKQLNFGEAQLHSLASECIGSLASIGGSNVTHLVQSHVDDAIRWLIDNDEKKKYQAVLVLRELCKASPIIAFNKLIQKHYKHILQAAGDGKQNIRQAAADCLSVFLQLLSHRESQLKLERFKQCYQYAIKALQATKQPTTVHMGLLIIKALLKSFSSQLQGSKAQIITEILKKVITNKIKTQVKPTLVQILPMLAKADPKKKGNQSQKQEVYISLGELSKIIKPSSNFKPYFIKIIQSITTQLKKTNPFQNSPRSLLTCIGLLSENFGRDMIQYCRKGLIVDVIDRMLYFGLCPQLINTFSKLSQIQNGAFKKTIQIRLLQMISRILTDSVFQLPVTQLITFKKKNDDQQPQQQGEENPAFSHTNNKLIVQKIEQSKGPLDSLMLPPPRSIKQVDESLNPGSNELLQQIGSLTQMQGDSGNFQDLVNNHQMSGGNQQQQSVGSPVMRRISSEKIQPAQQLKLPSQQIRQQQPLTPQLAQLIKDLIRNQNNQVRKVTQNVKNAINTYIDSFSHQHQKRQAKLKMEMVALKTLGQFNFGQFSSNYVFFVQQIVVHFLKNPNPGVRKQAIKTGCSLTLRRNVSRLGGSMRKLITDVLDKFLQVAMTDQDDKIRYAMLKYLNPQFDAFLATHQNLQRLFRCLNDPYVKVRKSVVTILARLMPHNSALIHSKLCNLLAELLQHLEYSNDLRGRQQNAFLLAALIGNCHKIAQAHASTISRVLLDKLVDSQYNATSSFITAIIEAFGELAKGGGRDLQPFVHTLIPILMKHMRNQSFPSRRKVAINTLTLIIQNTGFVVRPYFRYPELIYDIRTLIQSENSFSIRNPAFRLIGTLGALDPHTFKQALLNSSINEFSLVQDDLFQSVQYQEFKQEIFNSALTNPDHQRHVQAAMIALGGGISGQTQSSHHNIFQQQYMNNMLNQQQQPQHMNFMGNQQAGMMMMMPYLNAINGGVGVGNNLNQLNNIANANHAVNYQNINNYPMNQINNNGGVNYNGVNNINNFNQNNQFRYNAGGLNAGPMGMMQPYFINHQQSAADPLTQALQKLQLHATSSTDPSRSDNVYDMTAITVLMRVLVDPTLSDHHDLVMTSLEYIFKKLGSVCAPFVPLIVPSLLQMIQLFPDYRPRLLEQLAILIDNVREKIAPTIAPILHTAYFCLQQIRDPPSDVVLKVVDLIRKLVECVANSLSSHLNILLPKILLTIQRQHNMINEDVSRSALQCLISFKTMLNQYLYLVIPVLLRVASSASRETSTREKALMILKYCVSYPRFEQFTSDIIHSVLKIVNSKSVRLAMPSFQLLREMSLRMKSSFTQYLPLVLKIASKEKQLLQQLSSAVNSQSSSSSSRSTLTSSIQNNHSLSESAVELWFDRQQNIQGFYKEVKKSIILSDINYQDKNLSSSQQLHQLQQQNQQPNSSLKAKRKRQINIEELIRKFDTSNLNLKDDWVEWLKNTSVELLRQNPSHILYSCCSVAEVYPPMAADLYNVAFMSLWKVLIDMHKEYILRNLYKAISDQNTPTLIHQTLLNLIEYMEHDNQVPLIRAQDFSQLAQRCNAYAKALRYSEQNFENKPQQKQNIQKLISINYALSQPEAARGVLVYLQKKHGISMNQEWFQKLRRWNDALLAYRVKQQSAKGNPGTIGETGLTPELLIGKMQCYQALSEWEEISEAADQYWGEIIQQQMHSFQSRVEQSKEVRRNISRSDLLYQSTIAQLSACAAWNLQNWGDLQLYIERIANQDSYEKHFYLSILSIQQSNYLRFEQQIARARQLLDNRFTTLLSESYSRAYSLILELQYLKQLEQIVIYKRNPHNLELRHNLKDIWAKRLKNVRRDIDIWQKSLALRSIVLSPAEQQLQEYLQYADMCREDGRLKICGVTLGKLKQKLENVKEFDSVDSMPTFSDRSLLNDQAKVDLALLKLMHSMGQQNQALNFLREIVCGEHEGNFIKAIQNIDRRLQAEFYLQLGMWEKENLYVRSSSKKKSRNSLPTDELIQGNRGLAFSQSFFDFGGGGGGKRESMIIHQDSNLAKDRQQNPLSQKAGVQRVLENLKLATQLDPMHYIAWHNFAMMNLEVFANQMKLQWRQQQQGKRKLKKKSDKIRNQLNWPDSAVQKLMPIPENRQAIDDRDQIQSMLRQHQSNIKPNRQAAVTGFIKAISLGKSDITKTLQDTLRLLKLWFNYGESDTINQLIRSSFDIIDVKAWLAVTPQLLARLDIHKQSVRATLIELLERIVKLHPQAVIYPLSVLKSTSQRRREAALQIMANMRQHSPVLVDQIDIISNELVRIAILLPQQWIEAIQEAWRIYFVNHNSVGLINHFRPLHQLMRQKPQTLSQISFHQAYGAELREAEYKMEMYETMLRKRLRNQQEGDNIGSASKYSDGQSLQQISKQSKYQEQLFLKQAWDLYISVFKRLGFEYPNNHSDPNGTQFLQSLSPKLSQTKNCQVMVPGFFRTARNTVQIAYFGQKLTVFTRTKRQPKILSIFGADHKEYLFLLKGHQDIRQDERAMQLFGLVNTLLARDQFSSGKDLSIQRYPAIPLSVNAGLIGWVPNCDTLYEIIKEYRKSEKIVSTIESKMIDKMCQHFDKCTSIQKVEIFKYALENTHGQDLQRMLWKRSANSQIWLERRTNYTRSHAVMCMVGHVLGLGDRHPSNIMLDRFSGKIVHIDFGDCFEIAMRREKFPQKVPFRLTRMMVKAMEVCGIEGNFRKTAENTMRVLRSNKQSLMAVLQAFVYDPITSFHLLTAKYLPKGAQKNEQNQEQQLKEDKRQKKSSQIQRREKDKLSDIEKSLIQTYRGTIDIDAKNPREQQNIDLLQMLGPDKQAPPSDILNKTAQSVMNRIERKLNGTQFGANKAPNAVQAQVDLLINQAMSHQNLAASYIGWCPYW